MACRLLRDKDGVPFAMFPTSPSPSPAFTYRPPREEPSVPVPDFRWKNRRVVIDGWYVMSYQEWITEFKLPTLRVLGECPDPPLVSQDVATARRIRVSSPPQLISTVPESKHGLIVPSGTLHAPLDTTEQQDVDAARPPIASSHDDGFDVLRSYQAISDPNLTPEQVIQRLGPIILELPKTRFREWKDGIIFRLGSGTRRSLLKARHRAVAKIYRDTKRKKCHKRKLM